MQAYLPQKKRKTGITRSRALHALARIGTGTEIAEGVEYLICAEWVTGVALEVDGGIGLGASNF